MVAGVSRDGALCVGIEHIDDIIADLEQALAASARNKMRGSLGSLKF